MARRFSYCFLIYYDSSFVSYAIERKYENQEKDETIAQVIQDYLIVNYSQRVNSCCDDTYYTCERYSIDPEHLAKCITEYNPKDSEEVKKEKMWYAGYKGYGEGWLRPSSDCTDKRKAQ